MMKREERKKNLLMAHTNSHKHADEQQDAEVPVTEQYFNNPTTRLKNIQDC